MDDKKRNLRIVFLGTPEFAAIQLKAVIEAGFEVAAVVTAPDKPAGRGRLPKASAVKELALSYGLTVLQPTNLKSEEFLEGLRSFQANLNIVVAFRMLPEVVWKMPEQGTFNLHASLLPQYRGAAPINRVLMNGETTTGLTTFFLSQEIDTGKIIERIEIPILESDDAGSLHDRMAAAGSELVVSTLKNISLGRVNAVDQAQFYSDSSELKQAPKIFRDDCLINWNQNSKAIHNQIRGLSPVPAAFTVLISPEGAKFNLKVFKAIETIIEDGGAPGSILTDGKQIMAVKTIDGYLELKEIQLEGKKRMEIREFLRGFRVDNKWMAG